MKWRVFLGWTSTKLGLMFLLKDTRQWRWWGSNPRSRVKHSTDWATALPLNPYCKIHFQFKIPSTKSRKFQKQSRPQWVLWYFHIHVGSGHFCVRSFEFHYFCDFQKNDFWVWRFVGYFEESSQNWTIFRGHFYAYQGLYLRSMYSMGDIYFIFQILFWVPEIRDIFGVNGRCWGRA